MRELSDMEATMDLVPSERAALMHATAYDGGFVGLIAKRLVALSGDEQTFSVTSEGLRAMASHR
jgi:hypothetical protein